MQSSKICKADESVGRGRDNGERAWRAGGRIETRSNITNLGRQRNHPFGGEGRLNIDERRESSQSIRKLIVFEKEDCELILEESGHPPNPILKISQSPLRRDRNLPGFIKKMTGVTPY